MAGVAAQIKFGRHDKQERYFMDETGNPREHLIAWLRLIRASRSSPVRFRQLLDQTAQADGSVDMIRVLQLAQDQLRPAGEGGDDTEDQLDADLVWLEGPEHHLIHWFDPRYPVLLRQIADPPPALFVRGKPGALSATQLAVVGSRKPTAGGRRIAREFACALALNGITVTSGLAIGIDSAAHHGALDANSPTVAVLGNGLDTIYPPVNLYLADRICEHGALVSEWPPGTRPLPAYFPRRNRIISGLSTGVLVVEAALRSGSLITARLAMEQGREVFAVPGSIYSPLSRGCHALIRDGAKLTESIEHIVEELGPLHHVVTHRGQMCDDRQCENTGLDEQDKLLLDNMGHDPVSIDRLVEDTGISANETTARLLALELQNLIESLPGGCFIRKNQGIP